jgi:hypothetical protein
MIFDELLESASCFVINGDNRFDPYRVHHFPFRLKINEILNEILGATEYCAAHHATYQR